MYDVNETINGLYGFLYDENGQEMQGTQEFDAGVEYEKKEIKQAGKFLTSHKVVGGKGSGTFKLLKLDSRLQRKIAESPTQKYNYMAKLADPTSRGEEAVLFTGVSFDGTKLLNYQLGETAELDFPFTFDDYRYVTSID